ncbi:MAG: flagellar hook capping FlgD N-terminal domain-containing protein [Planctomycetota bacterium]|nr:flagellar hook capping FlgD N-terminal domain-containing protein [Planctomycetota bacterium]
MSQISDAVSADSLLRTGSTDAFSEMSSEDFIRIMFTELTNQDPFEPNDSSALLEQINSIRSIESDMKITEQLEALVTENQLASASNMIGKFIAGRTEDFETVTGFVVSVIRQDDTINLELDTGWWVPIGNVETVLDPGMFEEPEGDGEVEGDGGEEQEGEGQEP